MKKPAGFDELQVREGGQLAPGGYVCRIIGVKEQKSKTGKDMIVVAVDVEEGESKGYFKDKFDANTKADKTWPNAAVSYILLEDKDGNANEQFKKFITYAEKSNNMVVNWGADYNQFKGKLIGATFRREQFQGNNGLAFNTKVAWFNTVEQIRKGVDVPADKLLQGVAQPQANDTDDSDLPF